MTTRKPKETVVPLAWDSAALNRLRRQGATHAAWTGEFRPPRAGELYISGAIPEAYDAPGDLPGDAFIARPVRQVVTYRYEPIDPEARR